MASQMLAVFLTTALAVGSHAVAAAKQEVEYRNDTITVRLDQAPLKDVVDEIARESGAQLRGELLAPYDVTTEFERVPTKEALERLLKEQNFTLTYADDGRLKQIELKALREATVRRPVDVKPEGLDPNEPEYQRATFLAFEGRERVPVDPKLAKVLGDARVNWDLLGNAAYGSPDPAVRRAAVRAAMRAIEADAALRAALEDATRGIGAAELAAFVRARCYNRAEELMRNVARETELPEVRTRARDVLHELKRAPFRGPLPYEFTKARNG